MMNHPSTRAGRTVWRSAEAKRSPSPMSPAVHERRSPSTGGTRCAAGTSVRCRADPARAPTRDGSRRRGGRSGPSRRSAPPRPPATPRASRDRPSGCDARPPRFRAAPRSSRLTTRAVIASSTVPGRNCFRSCSTGRRVVNDSPRSPRRTLARVPNELLGTGAIEPPALHVRFPHRGVLGRLVAQHAASGSAGTMCATRKATTTDPEERDYDERQPAGQVCEEHGDRRARSGGRDARGGSREAAPESCSTATGSPG